MIQLIGINTHIQVWLALFVASFIGLAVYLSSGRNRHSVARMGWLGLLWLALLYWFVIGFDRWLFCVRGYASWLIVLYFSSVLFIVVALFVWDILLRNKSLENYISDLVFVLLSFLAVFSLSKVVLYVWAPTFISKGLCTIGLLQLL
jgi:hypothetical protein